MDLEALDQAIVDLIKQGRVRVPPYPAVASQLAAMLDTDTPDAARLGSVVRSDQGLAAAVLRFANSAHFGTMGEVTSLQQAIVRVGADELLRIAWAATLGADAVSPGALLVLRQLVWRQAVSSAFLCQQLAPGRGLRADEAFTCGLLHRFGRTVALWCLEQVLARGDPAVALPASQWMDLVTKYEVELGLVAAVAWRLPEPVVRVISVYRTPEAAGEFRDVAELVAMSAEIVELLEREAAVTEELLVSCRHVGGRRELAQILRLVQALPSVIASLVPESPPSGPRSLVRPATAPPPREASPRPDLVVSVVKAKGEVEYRATELTKDGASLLGREPLPVNSLVKLRLEDAAKPLTFWATVQGCEAGPDGAHEVSIQLFGADSATRQRWAELARGPTPAVG